MRKQAAIDQLSTVAATLVFPRFDSKMERFKSTLHELVRENFGYHCSADLSYDETSGKFFFSHRREHVASLGETVFYASRTFSIDPSLPLREQFDRIALEMESFEQERITVGRAIVAVGGKV